MHALKPEEKNKGKKQFLLLGKRYGAGLAAAVVVTAAGVFLAVHFHNLHPHESVIASGNIIQSGQWAYMPGAEIKSDGLHIEHRDFRIVQQDGSGAQPNPPVNEYGTHLNVPDNFTIQADIHDRAGPASIQLYAAPPIISDEFRVEPKSIRLTFDDRTLTVRRWDGKGTDDLANQVPIQEQTFATLLGADASIKLTHTNHQLSLEINNKHVGTVAADGTFSQGSMWLGTDAEAPAGHFTISRLTAKGHGGGKVLLVDTSAERLGAKQTNGLQQLATARRKDFKIGADIALWALTSDSAYRQRLFGGDFGIITPENELKWQFTEPLPGVFDFHQADAIVHEAQKYGMKVHGHNLVFSEALPRWVQDLPTDTPEQKAKVKQVLISHVIALTSHYKGVIDDWDINEIFADEDSDSVFRDSVFYRAMGSDYVRIAAEAARTANPNIRIWLNDYGMETDTGSRKQAADTFTLDLKRSGLIYGVGRQSHIYDTETDLIVDKNNQAPELSADIQLQNERGIMMRISELDAPRDGYDGSSQAQQFTGIVKACLAHSNCQAVSFWSIGPTDMYQENGQLQAGVDSMFDARMQPTNTYYALQKILR